MTTTIEEEDDETSADGDGHDSDTCSSSNEIEHTFSNTDTASSASTPESSFTKLQSHPVFPGERLVLQQPLLGNAGSPFQSSPVRFAGFNGRVNKVADTCYVFWVVGSLTVGPSDRTSALLDKSPRQLTTAPPLHRSSTKPTS